MALNLIFSARGINFSRIKNCAVCYKFSQSLCFSSLRSFSTIPEETEDPIQKKIIYNSLLHKWGFLRRKKFSKLEKKRQDIESEDCIPVSLRFLEEGELNYKDSDESQNIEADDTEDLSEFKLNLPYKLKSTKGDVFVNSNERREEASEEVDNSIHNQLISDNSGKFFGKWMNDYEKYSEEELSDEVDPWTQGYGTPDSSMAVSKVPCGGCGALLHCQDPSIPGYLPSEIFKNCDVKDLRETVCQRCHFLKNYNTALSVAVDPDDYPKILSEIKNKKALVLLIADMTDLPCSIWPGILDVIGTKQPLFLIGNKIDLLPGDRKGWTDHALRTLRYCLPRNAVIYHQALISAKTGFGIEELINKLHNFWQYKGDVYLVGCTNVGKSTLFNALLQSDYCKVKAVDLIQRATTAPWPGTTLHLLKFPILRPEGWRLYMRTQRLKEERIAAAFERKLKKQQRVDKKSFPQLIGHIGRTFEQKRPKRELNNPDNFSPGKPGRFGLDPNDPDFALSKWVYDTPGVLTREQCLDLLTTEEISLTVPKNAIVPRTFNLKPGWTLFIAALARIDYISGKSKIRVTVFGSPHLPVTIVGEESAEEVYNELIGTDYMGVPQGPQERLNQWPGLRVAKEATFIGLDRNESCADVTLSSAGWVSLTPDRGELVKLAFWSPEGRGVHVRSPSLLPRAVCLSGRRLGSLPAYGRTRPYIR